VSGVKGAASAAPEFPRTLAAVQKAEGDQWAIADAVLFEVGPPSEHGVRDNSRARFDECAQYLRERGFEYEPDTLREMRDTARAFPEAARAASCSYQAHRKARSPEMLAEAIRRNNGNPPTTRFIEQMRREIREAEEAAERKRQADRQRRAEETERKAHEKAQAARDERDRARAQEQARKAEQRRLQIEREQEEAERKRTDRKRKEAEAKAAKLAKELEDKDVAEALARDKSVGARRVTNAVHEKEAAHRRKVREANEQRRNAEALPLPAFVPKMVGEIDAWVIAMRGITDDDLAGLPADDPFVAQLNNVIEDLAEQALRWNTILGENSRWPGLEVIEGTGRVA